MNRMIVYLVVSLVAAAHATKFSDCGSKTGQVSSVEVTDCPDGVAVCPLKRGTKAGITIKFTSSSESASLKAVVHGVIHSVPLPFSLPQADGCKSGVTCPIQKGKSYTYANNLDIRNSYPPLDVTVRWELKDGSNTDVVCVEIPCKIQ